jgi:NTE family protein
VAVRTAFVLGGGGLLGSNEVGMLHALLEADVRPDLVLGTSVGAVNGAAVAADPTIGAVETLAEVWERLADSDVYRGGAIRRARIEDLTVPFQCVAASIERAAEHWFTTGPVVDAVLASSAVPGVLPPVLIGDEHFLDGGLVNSIPVGRAVSLGARRVFVLQVGRVDRPLAAPTKPWQVASVAFEIARRHRFAREMSEVPDGVEVHVLPTGADEPPRPADLSALRYRDFSSVPLRIAQAHAATRDYLARSLEPRAG